MGVGCSSTVQFAVRLFGRRNGCVQYAVDQNVAPVLDVSYGECLTSSPMDVQVIRTWAKQANAQGIRWVSGSGDSGAGGCYQSIQYECPDP